MVFVSLKDNQLLIENKKIQIFFGVTRTVLASALDIVISDMIHYCHNYEKQEKPLRTT